MVVQTLPTLKTFPAVGAVPSLVLRPMHDGHVTLEVVGVGELPSANVAGQFSVLRPVTEGMAVELSTAVKLLAANIAG